jgi:hypothetical protein
MAGMFLRNGAGLRIVREMQKTLHMRETGSAENIN